MATPQPINVDCEEYGVKAIRYSTTDRSQADIERLRQSLNISWSEYWRALLRVTNEMAEDVQGVYDFVASFASHQFEIEIDDFDFSAGSEYVSFRVKFLDSDSQVIFPIFDTSFHGLDVNHYQPVF